MVSNVRSRVRPTSPPTARSTRRHLASRRVVRDDHWSPAVPVARRLTRTATCSTSWSSRDGTAAPRSGSFGHCSRNKAVPPPIDHRQATQLPGGPPIRDPVGRPPHGSVREQPRRGIPSANVGHVVESNTERGWQRVHAAPANVMDWGERVSRRRALEGQTPYERLVARIGAGGADAPMCQDTRSGGLERLLAVGSTTSCLINSERRKHRLRRLRSRAHELADRLRTLRIARTSCSGTSLGTGARSSSKACRLDRTVSR